MNKNLFKILTTSILAGLSLASIAKAETMETAGEMKFIAGVAGNFSAYYFDAKDQDVKFFNQTVKSTIKAAGGHSGRVFAGVQMNDYITISGHIGYESEVTYEVKSTGANTINETVAINDGLILDQDNKITNNNIGTLAQVYDTTGAVKYNLAADKHLYTVTASDGVIVGGSIAMQYPVSDMLSLGIKGIVSGKYGKQKVDYKLVGLDSDEKNKTHDFLNAIKYSETNYTTTEDKMYFSGAALFADASIELSDGMKLTIGAGIGYRPALDIEGFSMKTKKEVTTTISEIGAAKANKIVANTTNMEAKLADKSNVSRLVSYKEVPATTTGTIVAAHYQIDKVVESKEVKPLIAAATPAATTGTSTTTAAAADMIAVEKITMPSVISVNAAIAFNIEL